MWKITCPALDQSCEFLKPTCSGIGYQNLLLTMSIDVLTILPSPPLQIYFCRPSLFSTKENCFKCENRMSGIFDFLKYTIKKYPLPYYHYQSYHLPNIPIIFQHLRHPLT